MEQGNVYESSLQSWHVSRQLVLQSWHASCQPLFLSLVFSVQWICQEQGFVWKCASVKLARDERAPQFFEQPHVCIEEWCFCLWSRLCRSWISIYFRSEYSLGIYPRSSLCWLLLPHQFLALAQTNNNKCSISYCRAKLIRWNRSKVKLIKIKISYHPVTSCTRLIDPVQVLLLIFIEIGNLVIHQSFFFLVVTKARCLTQFCVPFIVQFEFFATFIFIPFIY